jgi:pentatricopeptide repeat protein
MQLNASYLLQVFFSALIDVAGHAGKLDTCFDLLNEMEKMNVKRGVIAYSSIMGACSNVSSKMGYCRNLSNERFENKLT